jgi:Peptidase family M28
MTRRPAPTLLTMALVAVAATALPTAAQTPRIDPQVAAALARISEDSLHAYLSKLVSFGTRNAMSISDRPNWGVKAAREYIMRTMQGFSSKLQVSLDCYQVDKQGRITQPTQICNVMAVLPGRSARRIYISGHYDSVARQADGRFDWSKWDNVAPGADDDGSGTTLTMECARVLSQSGMDFDATLVFIAFDAEEEGLVGSSLHAARAVKEGWRIDADLNNDIVGAVQGGNGIYDSRTVRVFSEQPMDSPSRELARYVRRWAAVYVPSQEVRLIAREDRFLRGGDHTSFNRQGFAGVRFTESRENYSRQHIKDDTLGAIDFQYLAKNARINAAVAASLALAPPAPEVMGRRGPTLGRGESGYDADLHWEASPGAVGYRIVWREDWTPDWRYELDVGNVTEYTLPNISIDDYVFGVAAVDASGHESMVAAYERPQRRESAVRQGAGGR